MLAHQERSLVHERQQMLEQFFASAPDAMLITDDQGRIIDFNEQAKRLFGYTLPEIVGQQIEALVPEHSRARHEDLRREFVELGKTLPAGEQLELHARKKDGTLVPVDIALTPLRFPEGLRVMAVVRDMTERKASEQKIKASLHEKEVLLREVHHRVKNNLAVVCSLF